MPCVSCGFNRKGGLAALYAFDPKRQAVLLLGTDKTGMSDDRFYRTYVPRAEALWEEYLREMERER